MSVNESGFTLMEVLIAVALMSVLLVALYETLFPVMTSQARIESELERTREIRRFLDIFSMEVRSSFFKDTDTGTLFFGEKGDSRGRPVSRFSFTAFTYPIIRKGRPSGDLRAISYFIEETPEGIMTLFKQTWNPYTGDVDGAGFKAEVVEDVEGFLVSYYNGKDWSKAWDSTLEKSLPHAVRAVVTVKDRGELREFSTIARVRIG